MEKKGGVDVEFIVPDAGKKQYGPRGVEIQTFSNWWTSVLFQVMGIFGRLFGSDNFYSSERYCQGVMGHSPQSAFSPSYIDTHTDKQTKNLSVFFSHGNRWVRHSSIAWYKGIKFSYLWAPNHAPYVFSFSSLIHVCFLFCHRKQTLGGELYKPCSLLSFPTLHSFHPFHPFLHFFHFHFYFPPRPKT